mgnify:CR=1 FL=1
MNVRVQSKLKLYVDLFNKFLPEKNRWLYLYVCKALFFSFILYSILITYFSSQVMKSFFINLKNSVQPARTNDEDNSINEINTRIYQKNIMARNIFNRTGEIPFDDSDEGANLSSDKLFEKAQCAPETEKMPVEMIGIIYTGNPKTSLVALKDPKVLTADIYRVGDKILDYPLYSVSKITGPNSAEFRNGHKKICLSLVTIDGANIASGSNTSSIPNGNEGAESDETVLTMDFVKNELGDGFVNILKSSRLVPAMTEGKMEGFKIFSILPNTLFDKIGLKNGDIITKINSVDLNDPSQGFQIYEAFQNENILNLSIKRGGVSMTRKAVVK